MTPRTFAAIVGIALIAAAGVGLLWQFTVTEPGRFGTLDVTCSNAITAEPWDGSARLGGAAGARLADECTDAALPRRVIFGAIGGLGVITLAGSVLVRQGSTAAGAAGRTDEGMLQ